MKSYEKVSTFPVQIFLINKQETCYCNKPKASEPPQPPRMPLPPLRKAPAFNIFRFNLFKQILIELEEKNVFPGAGHKSFRSEVVLKHAVFHHTKVLRLILPKENSPTEYSYIFSLPSTEITCLHITVI